MRGSVVLLFGWFGLIWWLDKHVTIHDNLTGVIIVIILTMVFFNYIAPMGIRMEEERREKQLKENENLNDDKKPNNDY